MNKDATSYKYGRAILPAKFCICGVELKSLCLGHLILLEETGNPLINDATQDASLEEALYWLFQALLICSMTYEDGIKILSDDKLYEELFKEFSDNLIKNMDMEKDWNFIHKLNLYKNYLIYHMEMPIYTEERQTNPEVPSGTDWKTNLLVTFKKLGYSDTEIINMNIKKLFYEWCSFAESEGALKVMNKFDLKQLGKIQ